MKIDKCIIKDVFDELDNQRISLDLLSKKISSKKLHNNDANLKKFLQLSQPLKFSFDV